MHLARTTLLTIVLCTPALHAQHSQPAPDLFTAPWSDVRLALERNDSLSAQQSLSQIAGQNSLSVDQRAYAWRWAGQLALRERRLTEARGYLMRAYQLAPDGSEAEATLPRLAEIALLQLDDVQANRWLQACTHAQDPVVQSYGLARAQAVQERLRRKLFRPVFSAILLASLLTLLALGARSARADLRAFFRRLGKTTLWTETLAFVVVAIAPRVLSSIALSSVALVTVGSAVFAAIFIASWPSLQSTFRAAGALALLCTIGAGSYLALDYLYWTPTRPIAP